jgi:urease accessory protein
MVLGAALHLRGFDLPFAEGWVSFGVVAIGAAAAVRPTLPLVGATLVFVVAGLMHGYALGEAVIGAEATPLAAYLVGLIAVQATLISGIAILARPLWARPSGLAGPRLGPRLAGAGLVMVGVAALTIGLPSLV